MSVMSRVEDRLHVGERVDRDTALADFAGAEVMIGVVAVERRKMKCCRESGLSLREQIVKSFVRMFRRSESGELAHRPELAAISGRVNAARVGELAGISDLAKVLIGDR